MSQLLLPNPNPELSELITRYESLIQMRVGQTTCFESLSLDEKKTLLAFYIRLRESIDQQLTGVTKYPWRHPVFSRAQRRINALYRDVQSSYYPALQGV